MYTHLTPWGLVDLLGPRGFYTNVMVQRPVMETNSDRNPIAAISGPPEDPSQMVATAPCPPQSDSWLDGEKTGATLLFSGGFLVLAGVIFTTMGWQHYLVNPTFEWTQLLGPILISVGGTFMLTSACRFGIICCLRCSQWDEEAPAMEQTSMGHSFTLSGVNQQVMLCGATPVLRIPPVYNFVNQEVCQAIELQPGGSVNGVYCVHNAAFAAEEEDSSAHGTETDRRRSR